MPDEAFDDDYDGPWKEAMEHAPLHCLDFFFPDICEDIDVTEEYDCLSEELRKSFPTSEQSKRIADKVFKFWTHEKDPLIIHGEIQTYWEEDFAERMDVCNWRVKERFGSFTVTFAIYGDDNPEWQPDTNFGIKHGCSRVFQFRTSKLLQFARRIREMLKHSNPVALLVVAHLVCRRTRGKYGKRARWKFRLMQRLYQLELLEPDFQLWYLCLDWLLRLPESAAEQFHKRMKSLTQEIKMPYVTTAERIGRKEGHKEGIKEGIKEGRKEGLVEAIERVHESKFGPVPSAFRQRLTEQEEPMLRRILLTVIAAQSAEEAQRQPS